VAGYLIDKIQSEECTASDVANALKMLKDNNITCAPSEDNKIGELNAALAKRKAAAGPASEELREALDAVASMRVN